MHTALLYLAGLLLLALLIAVFRRSLPAFCAVMVLLWWTGGQTTDPAELENLHGAQAMIAKTIHGYTFAIDRMVNTVEHSAQAMGVPPAT